MNIRFGLVWFGLVWSGLVRYGLVLVWFGLVWFGLVWFGLVWFGLVFKFRIQIREYTQFTNIIKISCIFSVCIRIDLWYSVFIINQKTCRL